MRKGLCFLFLCFCFISNVSANDKVLVGFNKCVDGDTAKVVLNDEVITVRFLAIDTPETKHPTKKEEVYGKEASSFVCNHLKEASNIYIEYDDNSEKFDKYERHLVWIYVDNMLLQDLVIKEGLAKVAYLYGDYQYTDALIKSEKYAKEMEIGIWSDKIPVDYISIALGVIAFIIVIIMFIFSSKYRKKSINKIKRKFNRQMKKFIN